jgi:transmembrane sensor
MNKSFAEYQFEDFVTDESFINFCRRSHPENVSFWEDWIRRHPEKNILIEKAEYYVRNFSITIPEDEYQEELSKIKNSIEQSTRGNGYRSVIKYPVWNNPLKSRRSKLIGWMVPVLAILLAGGYFFVKRFNRSASDLIENFNSGTVPLVFTIPDGTVITLAPHSGLKYPRRFDLSLRKVYLDGEASFHVTADPAQPFKVYQDDLVATVLGTVFNIRKERRDSAMVVELLKGRLQVEIIGPDSKTIHSMMLLPNERVVYTRFNRQLSKEQWQIEKDLVMRMELMAFRQDSYDAIANKIKSSYGITLINLSNKKSWRFTGEFTNSTAAEIISGICKVEGLTCEERGDTILIK